MVQGKLRPVFKNADLERTFSEDGYVIFDLLSMDECQYLIEKIERTDLPDRLGFGFNVAMDTRVKEIRLEIQETLTSLMAPKIGELLFDRKPYSCSYMIKEPMSGLVPAHQDWSYTDESEISSIMCWVSLQDVDENNGAMGFIPGSHKFFSYPRVFPFPYAKSPVELHKLPLMEYLKIEPMKQGQVVFFNNKTIHGSLPNFTDQRRLAYCMSFATSDQPILHYQFTDQNDLSQVSLFNVKDDFFVNYNNETLRNILTERNGKFEEYEPVETLDFQLPQLSWEDWEAFLNEKGLHPDEEIRSTLKTFLSNA